MADLIELPDVLTTKYWSRSVTPDFEKTSKTKVGDLLEKLAKAFGDVDQKALDVGDIEKGEIPKRRERIASGVVKPLNALATLLKQLEAEANKTLAEAKKAGKESAVRAITSAIKVFTADIGGVLESADETDEDLAKGNIKSAKTGGDKKAGEAFKKQTIRLGTMSRKSIRDLLQHKARSIPFVYAADKVKAPYKAGTEWAHPCLLHFHPKAGKGTVSILRKLLEGSPDVSIGEATCEGKLITFNCLEGKAPNPKQLKDTMKFLMKNYAPAFKVMKGGVIEGKAEDSEGKDDEQIPDDVGDLEDDDAPAVGATSVHRGNGKDDTKDGDKGTGKDADKDEDGDSRTAQAQRDLKAAFAKRATEIQNAIKANDAGSKDMKDWAVKLASAMKDGSDLDEAKKLFKRIEDRLDGKVVDTEVSADLEAAFQELAKTRQAAASGAKRVADLIRRSYKDDPQEKKAGEGAAQIEAASQKLLATNVEATFQSQLRGADTRKRLAVADTVQKVREAVAKHELLPDIDKSPFDPNLEVVAPYLASLQKVESMLRAGR
jgi:hypothetical protein